jgi:probable HAF family extracellular repeat protein
MNNATQRLVCTLVSVSVLSSMATLSWSQSLTWLGTLGGSFSRANGVSDNGVVVGDIDPNFRARGFRWQNGVMQLLGDQPDVIVSSARGVSADGSVVVGDMNLGDAGIRAYRWQNGVMQDLGSLSSVGSTRALGVSADGSVIVGDSRLTTGEYRAFRWQNGVMQNLGTLTFGSSAANGVSADGAVVVGTANNNSRAFRWQNGTMQDLGTLGGTGCCRLCCLCRRFRRGRHGAKRPISIDCFPLAEQHHASTGHARSPEQRGERGLGRWHENRRLGKERRRQPTDWFPLDANRWNARPEHPVRQPPVATLVPLIPAWNLSERALHRRARVQRSDQPTRGVHSRHGA